MKECCIRTIAWVIFIIFVIFSLTSCGGREDYTVEELFNISNKIDINSVLNIDYFEAREEIYNEDSTDIREIYFQKNKIFIKDNVNGVENLYLLIQNDSDECIMYQKMGTNFVRSTDISKDFFNSTKEKIIDYLFKDIRPSSIEEITIAETNIINHKLYFLRNGMNYITTVTEGVKTFKFTDFTVMSNEKILKYIKYKYPEEWNYSEIPNIIQ